MRVVFTTTLLAILSTFLSSRAEAQQSWTPLQTGIEGEIKGVDTPQPGTIIAVGNGGAIARSNDGGLTWTAQQSSTTETLWTVHFWSADSGVVMGDGGVILTTDDAGATWTKRTSGLNTASRSFLFGIAKRGDTLFAVGGELSSYSAAVLISTDRGVTWSKTLLDESLFLDRIVVLDASTMVVVGMHTATTGGGIYRTTDGGATWTTVHESPQIITSIASVGDRLIAVGSGGKLYRSDDRGATWPFTATLAQSDLLDVSLDSRGNGVAVGDMGNVMATRDSGTTWSNISIPEGDFLSDGVIDRNDGTIYVGGLNGTVYRSTLVADVAEGTTVPLTVRAEASEIVVDARQHSSDIGVAVYDLLGRPVSSAHIEAGVARIPVAAGGAYLVVCRNARGTVLNATTVTVMQ